MRLFKYEKAIDDFENAYKYNNQYYKAIINISKCYLQILQPRSSVRELERIHPEKNNQYYKDYIKEVIIIYIYILFLQITYYILILIKYKYTYTYIIQ